MTTTLAPPRHRLASGHAASLLANGGVYGVVILLILYGCLKFHAKFWAPENLVAMVLAVGLLGIVAVGVAFVTYSGHYADLSVPAIMAFSGIVAVSALRHGFAASLVCGIVAGLAVGAVNSLIIGWLRVNPIIWTLAMGAMLNGMILWLYSGQQVYPDENTRAGQLFLGSYSARCCGVPVIIIILAAMVAVGSFIMFNTRFGVQLRLIGSSYTVARLSGVPVRNHVAVAFLLSAFAAAIGGLLLTSFNKVGAAYIGAGYDFTAVTAVVIGGVTLAGGRGSIIGVLGGVLVIGLMQNILSLLGVGTFAKEIIQGVVYNVVVGTQAYYLRRMGRDDA